MWTHQSVVMIASRSPKVMKMVAGATAPGGPVGVGYIRPAGRIYATPTARRWAAPEMRYGVIFESVPETGAGGRRMTMRVLSICVVLSLLVAAAGALLAQKQVSDDVIYDQVRRKLANDPDVKGGTFDVKVESGVVTIGGVVEKEKFKAKAERLAKKVHGVRQVVLQIQIKKKS